MLNKILTQVQYSNKSQSPFLFVIKSLSFETAFQTLFSLMQKRCPESIMCSMPSNRMNQSFKFKQYQSLKYTLICSPLIEHRGFSFNLLIPSKLFFSWEKDVPPYIFVLPKNNDNENSSFRLPNYLAENLSGKKLKVKAHFNKEYLTSSLSIPRLTNNNEEFLKNIK